MWGHPSFLHVRHRYQLKDFNTIAFYHEMRMIGKHGFCGIHIFCLENRIPSNVRFWSGTASFGHVHFVSSWRSHLPVSHACKLKVSVVFAFATRNTCGSLFSLALQVCCAPLPIRARLETTAA